MAIDNLANKAKIVLQDAAITKLREGIIRATLLTKRSIYDQPEYQSYLNTPVYGSITFGDPTSSTANNYVDQFGEKKSFTPVRFHECTFQVSQSKNIVTTPLQGYKGTIKEYMSDGDFEISIDGRLSGLYIYSPGSSKFIQSSTYPSDYVQDLVEILQAPSHIPISNNILSPIFGINYAVVTSYNFPRDTAGMNYQKFQINLISDRPIEIILSSGDLENNQKISALING